MNVKVSISDSSHFHHAHTICEMMALAASVRGTGIAKRKPDYIRKKMEEGKAIIALDGEIVVGFCYIESWEDQKYVANSGLIIHPDYRNMGIAKKIKKATFDLSKARFPNAKLFGITTSMAVMKINSSLGYKPVTFSEITKDDVFWKGCESCTNYDILQRTNRSMCICTGMVCDLKEVEAHTNDDKKSTWNKFSSFMKNRVNEKIKRLPKIQKLIKNEK